MITENQYGQLLEFANVSSWAIWEPCDVPGKVKLGTDKVDMLDYYGPKPKSGLLNTLKD